MRLACSSFLAASLALAAISAAPAARADALLDEMTAFNGVVIYLSTGAPGVIIGAVRGGESAVVGFGTAADGKEPNGDTFLRIGSLSKVFAGATLASLVADGTVAFTDPIRKHLPGVRVPTRDGKEIRLVDLATHAAGLPREYARPDGAPFDGGNEAALVAALEAQELLFPPGTGAHYSNFGFDVLALALEKAAGKPYPELLRERVLSPAGMTDTKGNLGPGDAARAFGGTNFDGTPIPYSDMTASVLGSGSVLSTANDMVKWMKWHLDIFATADAEMRFLDHKSYLSRDGLFPVSGLDDGGGPMDAMGLGWVVLEPEGERPLILQKTGGYQGTFIFIAIAPSRGAGVFVAMNKFAFAGFPGMVGVAVDLLGALAPR